MLGAVGMLDVCTRYVVKRCGGILSQKHLVREIRAPQGQPESPFACSERPLTLVFRRQKSEIMTTCGSQTWSLLSPG